MIKCIGVHVGASMAHLPTICFSVKLELMSRLRQAVNSMEREFLSLSLSYTYSAPHCMPILTSACFYNLHFLENCVDRFHPMCVVQNRAPLALSCGLASKTAPYAIVHYNNYWMLNSVSMEMMRASFAKQFV